MEPAKIDWKRLESIFVEDKLYENINAPKWVDFLAPDDDESVDDEAWFCRPGCNHPKTAEDFLKPTTPISKLSSSAGKVKALLTDWNLRDGKLKRRGLAASDKSVPNEDRENFNPNSSTPLNLQPKSMKALIKSSTEKKNGIDDGSQSNEAPKLKSTLSARNLFGGKDVLGQITEFCNELKKMAMRAREKENDEKSDNDHWNEMESQNGERKDVVMKNEVPRKVLGEVVLKENERKPLLEVSRENAGGVEKVSVKEKQRKKKVDEAENIPIPVSLNLENIKQKGGERLQQIRTNPPSPQCFSATREPTTKTTPSRPPKSRLMERGILEELKQNKEMANEEVTPDKGRSFNSSSIVDGREARALDMFWFFKPCTLSS